ncbi:MAG: type I restriction enzyme HsdR N-terminal domain-containing protein [Bacteroidales bacterium]
MQSLNFPAYTFKIKTEEQRNYIFDNIRKRYVILTPEEWVRQHLITYLTEEKKYPASLMAVEMSLKINKMERRADIVLFSRLGKPFMIVECKAPGVKITQNAFDQAARYNMDMKVEYLAVSNGLVHYCARLNHADHSWEFLREIPDFIRSGLNTAD